MCVLHRINCINPQVIVTGTNYRHSGVHITLYPAGRI